MRYNVKFDIIDYIKYRRQFISLAIFLNVWCGDNHRMVFIAERKKQR